MHRRVSAHSSAIAKQHVSAAEKRDLFGLTASYPALTRLWSLAGDSALVSQNTAWVVMLQVHRLSAPDMQAWCCTNGCHCRQ